MFYIHFGSFMSTSLKLTLLTKTGRLQNHFVTLEMKTNTRDPKIRNQASRLDWDKKFKLQMEFLFTAFFSWDMVIKWRCRQSSFCLEKALILFFQTTCPKIRHKRGPLNPKKK